jgi:hypothetical protein
MYTDCSRAIAWALSHRVPGFKPGSSHVGFLVDKVVLGQVFSEYISVSPANLQSTNFSTITLTYHPALVQQASRGRSTKRLSLAPLWIIYKLHSVHRSQVEQKIILFQLTSGNRGIFPLPAAFSVLSTSYWLLEPLRIENHRDKRPCPAGSPPPAWGVQLGSEGCLPPPLHLSHSVRALLRVVFSWPLLLRTEKMTWYSEEKG